MAAMASSASEGAATGARLERRRVVFAAILTSVVIGTSSLRPGKTIALAVVQVHSRMIPEPDKRGVRHQRNVTGPRIADRRSAQPPGHDRALSTATGRTSNRSAAAHPPAPRVTEASVRVFLHSPARISIRVPSHAWAGARAHPGRARRRGAARPPRAVHPRTTA